VVKGLRDRALVQRILSGDRAAGERFVTEHYSRIYRLLRHLTGRVEAAEDLTQQTFVKAWEAMARFQGESSLATWLHSIAYHEYTHWLRSQREHVPLDSALNVPDDRAAHELEAVLVRGALAQLSPEHRETFLLYHVQGLSVPEVAAVLSVPAGTVKSRLFTARQRLRELLGESQEVNHHEMSAVQPECETL
jgi:RNA polymerase sigma-70 factor (ECF subfamily)